MILSDESIKKFQETHEKETGKKLSWQEASDAAYNLINFFDLLMKVDMRNNPERYRKNRNEIS